MTTLPGSLQHLGLSLQKITPSTGGGTSGPTYLPDVAGSTPWGWSVNKLYSSTSTNALTATRLSPAANQNIGFVGASFDTASAQTFQGASTLTNSKLFEQHGVTANDLVPVSTSPDLWLGNGGPDWSTFTQTAPFAIPSGVSFDRQNCTIFMVCRNPSSVIASGYFSFGSGTDVFGLRSYASQYTLQPVVDGVSTTAGTPNNKTIGVCGNELIIVHSNASRLRVWRDGEFTDFPAVTSSVMSAGGVLGKTFSINSRIDVMAFEVFATALSDADVTARQTAYRLKFGTMGATIARSIVGAGDSIMFGTGGLYNRTQTAELALLVPNTTIIKNIGQAGHFMGGPNLSSGHYQDWQVSSTRFKTAGAENILVINYGHNDIFQYIANQGKTAAQALTEMQNAFPLYCADSRNLAGFDKIIIQETFPDTSGGTSWTAEMEKARQLWNAWINTAPVDANGVLCWNYVDKVATDDTFGLSDAQTNSIPVGTPTGTFQQFETVTGGTSGATAMLARFKTGRFYLFGVTGTFASGETLTGGTSGATVVTTGLRVAQGMSLLVNSSDGTHPNEIWAPSRATHLNASLAAAPATPLSLSYVPVTVANQNSAYTGATPTARYGTPGYTYSIAAGTLPTGLSLNPSTGVISGTPTLIETKTGIVLRVTDAASATADSAAFQIAVGNAQQVGVRGSPAVSQLTTDQTALPITLPATTNSGDLLLIMLSGDANATYTWDNTTAGTWTLGFNDAQTANRLLIYSKISDGTEGGKTLAVTISSAQQVAVFAYALTGAQGALTYSTTGTRNTTGSTVDPPALTSGFPAGNNTRWWSVLALDNFITAGGTITQPTGYTLLPTPVTTSASGQATLAVAYKDSAVATEDPAAWTWTGSCAYINATVAVRAA